ncbi:MAG TPA: AbrB/MazE/SpoVT family DNA-binding domain-containing protein [Caulobacteraceae bacterium]|nr:AbrB/MazE/SpoVT family DNA-binding domain-containing protein [Caulobacteraceae bacterium]
MRAAVRRMGNSSGVIIPKPLLAELGTEAGDEIDMTVRDGLLVIAPVKKTVREGWAEDARRLASQGDDALAWPEFGVEEDGALEW